ncbi:hypothetical protein BDY19DRAFT_134415 [Irpex rosettiformis]|uniref:Uncharacterized protein n=1 Tax=Irpex rosettiformis TaxID=378272 RepID=A0ACB8U568_9APHY|nr:hypothetical protein BDY19DRAFT_134415 [Irpex rosettiformis]
MASIVNILRSSVRHRRIALTSAVGAARGRGIATTLPPAEEGDIEDQLSHTNVSDLAKMIGSAGDEVTEHITREPAFKPFSPHFFTKPSDFSREARIEQGLVRRSKRPYLGPGRAEAEARDVFRQLNIDPVHEATNSRLLSAFLTDMGKIKPRPVTNLTWRSQRKLGKAVRRARMIGIIPQLSRKTLSVTYIPASERNATE